MPVSPIRKGQYWAVKVDGNKNGDLIIGVVKSTRLNGDVILHNLFYEEGDKKGRSVKADYVLLKRNKLVSKQSAENIVQVYREMLPSGQKKARDAARAEAIDRCPEIRRIKLPTAQLELSLKKPAADRLTTKEQIARLDALEQQLRKMADELATLRKSL